MLKKLCTLEMVVACLVITTLPACKEPQTKEEPMQPKQEQPATKIVTVPSGLRYEVLKIADEQAKTVEKGQRVTVHYTGWLNVDDKAGKQFDSSVDRGQPFVFQVGVGHVIKGWDEGVIGMKVGEKRRLYVPANLGYGARGAGAVIPPNADLIFDVEVIAV